MRKTNLLLCALWLLMLPAHSEVRFQLLNNQQQADAARMLGKTVFEGAKMIVYDLEDNQIFECDANDQLSMNVNSSESEIVINSGEQSTTISIVDVEQGLDEITVSGIEAGSPIRIYSLSGALVKFVPAAAGTTAVSLAELTPGTYILVTNNNVVKLIKQ